MGEEINSDFISKYYIKNRVLVICNTVKKVQELYKEIKIITSELKNQINLFHSSFIKKHRSKKEKGIFSLGDKVKAKEMFRNIIQRPSYRKRCLKRIK